MKKMIKPLGITRLKMIELIHLALKMNLTPVTEKIISSGILKTVLSLFAEYEWNNMLHSQVGKIINAILDGSSTALKTHVRFYN